MKKGKFPRRLRWAHVGRFYELAAPWLKASALSLEGPEGGRALVLAPHIDDDAIGAGGTLSLHAASGGDIMALYFADCSPERVKEAKAAASVIGFDKTEFWEYESKTLHARPGIAARLRAAVEDYKPDVLYLPSPLERHNDHLAVNGIFYEACLGMRYSFSVYAYEVWSALVPNAVIDITRVSDKKREAIGCHKSQLAAHDWVEATLSLNRFRGISSGRGQYAEAFTRHTLKEYMEILRRMFAL
jgi:LmbE family N-acetylglucosaminyl deacetylase